LLGFLFITHSTRLVVDDVSIFSRLVPIRYLGGILKLPTYPNNDIGEHLLSVVVGLFIIQNIDMLPPEEIYLILEALVWLVSFV
jgi:hypothetical protein